MSYHQLTHDERFLIATLRSRGEGPGTIAAALGRSRTTVWREVKRNRATHDGAYRTDRAHEQAGARRKKSRRNLHFGVAELARVEELLKKKWSPEQISGWLALTGELSISHETVYRYVWEDKKRGGDLHTHLRWAAKKVRKRYGKRDRRGRLAGKRMISERPASVERRDRIGHWEIDTVLGNDKPCVLTLVERKTGYLLMGKMRSRTVEEANRVILELMARHPGLFKTVTSDNGTEFHGYARVEEVVGTRFYFAQPHHAWERGTNENTNGLVRQYLPKRRSMAKVTQAHCNAIAQKLNDRPRKRHAYKTPNECFLPN